MNQNQPTNDLPIDDAWAELLSAYHDGELSAAEQAEVEARVADDPAAQRWLAELGSLGSLCQEAIDAPQWRDVSKQVLAEAERRKAASIDDRPMVASQTEARSLEPEGEFGLPFGRSSRGWVWAGVAAAAAIMISYVDRPAQQPAPTIAQRSPSLDGQSTSSTPFAVGLDRMRQAVPGLRVVLVELTPDGRKQFVQSLARNGFGFENNPQSSLPQELAAARRAGLLLEPVARGPLPNEENDDQLMFVSAEAPRYSRLIQELEKDPSIYRVEADPVADPVVVNQSSNHQPTAESVRRSSPSNSLPNNGSAVTSRTAASSQPIRVIRFRMNITPQIGAAPKLKITSAPVDEFTKPKLESTQSEEAVRGEEALPDVAIAKNREAARSTIQSREAQRRETARMQSGRVPVVFVVKMRVPQPTAQPAPKPAEKLQ